MIPQPGRCVTVVKGDLAKKNGTLKEIRQKEFRVLVEGSWHAINFSLTISVELTPTEKCEALFKFDEISKRHEKKKKKAQKPVEVIAAPVTEEQPPTVVEQPNQKKVILEDIKVGVKSN